MMNTTIQTTRIFQLITTAVITFCFVVISSATQARPPQQVIVKNGGSKPVYTRSTVKKFPFFCNEVIASVGDPKDASCFRADNRTPVTPVPAGYLLVVTDIVTNRNALVDSDSFFLSVGRAGSGRSPVFPRFNFSGDQAQSPTIHFNSPYVVLWEGEKLRVFNGDTLGNIVDVFISGYLVHKKNYAR